ncbi:uncharacterized protein LOC131687372 [Topomyia yanbarensis]|uniref:uncharacterized protein LOC131687372 n=1 Tax=Topomyia yanbarensis TaxID=2498891 RepID=UPI00273BBA9B|nr:uncharacterized protein LOC131687372 [Topomyia yanbarensis]
MDQDEPTTYAQAISCPDKEEWIAAMDAEYESLVSNDAWEFVNPSPACNIVGSKWVYNRKLDANGKFERMKAKLLAHGCSRRFGGNIYPSGDAFYLPSCCSSGDIDLQYYASEYMLADILTKPLGLTKVKRFGEKMGFSTMLIEE